MNCGSPSTAVGNASRGTPWKSDSCIQPLKTRCFCHPSHCSSMVLAYASEALHVQQLAEREKENHFKEGAISSRIPSPSGRCSSEWICWTFERTCGGVANLFCARVTQHPAAQSTLGVQLRQHMVTNIAKSREHPITCTQPDKLSPLTKWSQRRLYNTPTQLAKQLANYADLCWFNRNMFCLNFSFILKVCVVACWNRTMHFRDHASNVNFGVKNR